MAICDGSDPVPVPDTAMGCYARRTSVEMRIAPGILPFAIGLNLILIVQL
jgi:hypothetical protein